MAEVIGIASGLVALVGFAFSSTNSLLQTIESFKSHQRSVRQLRDELEALDGVLQALRATVQNPNIDLSALKLPLLRCGRACEDFEKILAKCVARSGGSRTSFRDWAKLRYMCDDIEEFKNMLAGYKSTISIALGDANIRTTNVTADVLNEYQVLIKNTTTDLEDHLRDIDNKLAALSSATTTIPDGGATERQRIQEERETTQQCLEICAKVSAHIEVAQAKISANTNSSAYVKNSSVRALQNALDGASSHVVTTDALKDCKHRLASTTVQLQVQLEDINRRLRGMALQAPGTTDNESADREKIQEELESVKQCLAICADATDKLSGHRTNVFENVSADDDGHQVVVSTFGELISAKHIVAGARSAQWLGQMSDASLQQLSKDRSSIAMDKTVEEHHAAGVKFEGRYGAGRSLVVSRLKEPEKQSS